MDTNNEKKIRFTTLTNPNTISQIKLISYFTNQKLYELVDHSFQLYIKEFEEKYNTKIDSLIKFNNNLTPDSTNNLDKQTNTKNTTK